MMRKPRFTLRFLLIVVVVIAVVLSLDRRVEMLSATYARDVKTNPKRLLDRDNQFPWHGTSTVESIRDTTSISDRLKFRRSLVVNYTNIQIDLGFTTTHQETTIRVGQFGIKEVDHHVISVNAPW
ncbi:MAG: hypothetical protein ACI9G1_004014 [Pirellulaceae bacterium]|jgi:hypothetical protein